MFHLKSTVKFLEVVLKPQVTSENISKFWPSKMLLNACGRFLIESIDSRKGTFSAGKPTFRTKMMFFQLKRYLFSVHTFSYGGFIKGILRGVRCSKLFLHQRPTSWTTLELYSRAVFLFNEPAFRMQPKLEDREVTIMAVLAEGGM